MQSKNFFKRWFIRINRYLLGRKYMTVMNGPLAGYQWTVDSSYDYLLGSYEDPEVLRKFLSWLKADSVFYDIGSNIGFHALVANQVVTDGKIYAFEPMPVIRAIFEEHLARNRNLIGRNNIELSAMAISGRGGEVEFSNDIEHRDGNTYIQESYVFVAASDKIRVPCQSIDNLVAQGFSEPDIIKIDVEGAEYDVLIGAEQTLRRCKPHILLATHDCHLPGVQERSVAFLESLGYQLTHTGNYHKYMAGLDDYIAIHQSKF